MPVAVAVATARAARLHRAPLVLARRAPPLALRVGGLAVAQAVLGPARRWRVLQALVAAAAAGAPGLAPLRALATPLLCSWLYGLCARVFAPAHRRSLRFWKKVVPIYLAYKSTQTRLAVKNASMEERTKAWNRRHEWGAEKVRKNALRCYQGLAAGVNVQSDLRVWNNALRCGRTSEQVYNLCVELRGFYLKDGQFLGARSDFVPIQWCESLRRLQDCVPPVPFHQIEKTIREAYRINKVSQVFKTMDTVPLASATIAQVHRGEMPDGTQIALKAQYHDQERLCKMDLLNLRRLADYLQKHDMSFFDMNSVVEEFEAQIPAEFDFLREAEMMTTIRLNLQRANIHDVVIPRVLPGLVSRRALTMTFIDGCRADNSVALNLWGIKGKDVIKAIGRAYGQMLLVDGVAHCDPHLGNLIILRDKRVALIDFGQSKVISRDLRQKLCAFYLALSSKHSLYIMKTFGDLGIELDIRPEDIDEKFIEMIPVYANGMLDTAPLPGDVEINPFSDTSPLKQVPIKKFNPELFMILRTMGLLRSLTETLHVDRSDCVMSNIFKPYAKRGLRYHGLTEMEQKKRSMRIRSVLTTGVSSPFESIDGETTDFCSVC